MTPLTVLIVDDDPDIRTVVGLAIGLDAALVPIVAGNGAEAMRRIDEGLRPDGILLDIMMPEIDGTALFHAFRHHPVTRETPIVFMTAKSRFKDVQHYLQLGAADVIPKPFDPLTLAARVRAMIEGGRGLG